MKHDTDHAAREPDPNQALVPDDVGRSCGRVSSHNQSAKDNNLTERSSDGLEQLRRARHTRDEPL
jgi:hypothetical protein